MTAKMRWMLLLVWLATVAWLWIGGTLSAGAAIGSALASLCLFALPAAPARRRRSALQYIEMGKQPVGLP